MCMNVVRLVRYFLKNAFDLLMINDLHMYVITMFMRNAYSVGYLRRNIYTHTHSLQNKSNFCMPWSRL